MRLDGVIEEGSKVLNGREKALYPTYQQAKPVMHRVKPRMFVVPL